MCTSCCYCSRIFMWKWKHRISSKAFILPEYFKAGVILYSQHKKLIHSVFHLSMSFIFNLPLSRERYYNNKWKHKFPWIALLLLFILLLRFLLALVSLPDLLSVYPVTFLNGSSWHWEKEKILSQIQGFDEALHQNFFKTRFTSDSRWCFQPEILRESRPLCTAN